MATVRRLAVSSGSTVESVVTAIELIFRPTALMVV
jgi:hypothetical protein